MKDCIYMFHFIAGGGQL